MATKNNELETLRLANRSLGEEYHKSQKRVRQLEKAMADFIECLKVVLESGK